ncbi:MAG: biliverdin-producing heme oxygenase [Comamonadaceae bacterium]|nr:biliverdin-producing heme oxygenase [Comamonadaceae bacterium]
MRASPLRRPPPAYVARLRWLDRHDPGRLLAHAYVRYLGDLSGGQVVQRIVAAHAEADAAGRTALLRFRRRAHGQRARPGVPARPRCPARRCRCACRH